MAMKLQYNIENIGNIDKASVTIKRLTIIAGENSTGKTFVTKSLYTILNSVYQNHFANQIIKQFYIISSLHTEIKDNISNPAKIDRKFYDEFDFGASEIEKLFAELLECTLDEAENFFDKHSTVYINFDTRIQEYFNYRRDIQKFSKLQKEIDKILDASSLLMDIVVKPIKTIVDSINHALEIGFKKNYQITNLKSLINRNSDKALKLDIKNIGNIEIDQSSFINFDFEKEGIQKVQNVDNIIFFDSPIYIKIRKALERKNHRFFDLMNKENKYLQGYPEYIEQLYTFIDKEYIDTPDFNLISQEIQEKISGKLNVTKGGDINYSDNQGNTIPLSLTAMGISNIGLIDLLLRNNIINKDSFLIMDEPEVHLHPEWQVFLAEILYKIAKGGANIILATHSLDFLKQFEVILKRENENAEEIIAINKMPYKKEFEKLTELEKVNEVLDDLSKPFYNLYMQGI